MNPARFRKVSLLFSFLIFLGMRLPAFGHRDDYLDETLVYLTLEHKEVEAEYWFDYGGTRFTEENFIRHNLAVEYGITDRWMVDARGTLEKIFNGREHFQSGRVETRYRISEEGIRPVDLAFSLELNTEDEEEKRAQTALEPRLILSKDFREKLNLVLNVSEELPINHGENAFNTSVGCRYDALGSLRIGSELKYSPDTHEGTVIPQVWLLMGEELTLKLGFSWGFDRSREDFLRAALEVEF